jgi:hypothetical protein
MNAIQVSICLAAVIGLTACTSLPHDTNHINPPAIHRADSYPSSTAKTTSTQVVGNASQAENIPIDDYYKALQAARDAKTPEDEKKLVEKYVQAGITLVNSHCLRWFQHLSEQDIKKSFNDQNFNVIRALGTAFLGIGSANSVIVSTYGASNTAYESYSKNYGDAFLLAPNSRKVKSQVLSLLDNRAKRLLGDTTANNKDRDKDTEAKPQNFSEAYRKLERFADLCTHSTAKEIVNSALDQSVANATTDGKINLSPTDSATALADVKRDKELSDARVVTEQAQKRQADFESQKAILEKALKASQDALKDQSSQTQAALAQVQTLIADKSNLEGRLKKVEEALQALKP